MCKDAKAGVARDAEWPLSIVLHIRLPVPRRGFQFQCATQKCHVPGREIPDRTERRPRRIELRTTWAGCAILSYEYGDSASDPGAPGGEPQPRNRGSARRTRLVHECQTE